MSFASLKKNRGNFAKLTEQLEATVSPQKNSSNRDDRFWKPQTDKSGNGYALIRFLPPSEGEELPWARVFNHGFKGPGGWLIENCPTTIGKPCPVCEENTRLWNTGDKDNQNIVRERKRKLKYISNIYVVNDPSNPENNGQVFLYSYGKKIFDKLNDLMRPEFADEQEVNPFDLWEGANFKLKIRQVEGYTNYDKSEFEGVSALSDDDSQLETIYNKQYSLEEFTAPEAFKSYEQIQERLNKVLGSVQMTRTADEDFAPVIDETPPPAPSRTVEAPTFAKKEVPTPTPVAVDAITETELDGVDADDLSYFEKLANE
tara:strand:- start:562 stop:1509 length:948 start_codon:yes stop_codon:yes gene_type:complete